MQILGLLVALVVLVDSHLSFAIEVDAGVPTSQGRSLEIDQGYLKKLHFKNNQIDETTRRLLGIKTILNATTLQRWLDERIDLVISEKMELNDSIMVAPGVARYPEPKLLPRPDRSNVKPKPADRSDASEPVLVMSNTGAALYMMAKQNKALLALKKTNGELLPILSPHGGVIQIGRGLFLERLRVSPEAQDRPANSLSRLSTLFHESRHSDGHGLSLGFMHAICPEGHAYAGYPACDKNLNGPYTVGAQVLSSLIEACEECTKKEKTVLKMIEADSRSRILKSFKDEKGRVVQALAWSDRPERMISFSRSASSELE
jgi:hypothetical protein